MPKPIVHTADVLIIGGGFSGMWAAIRAAQQGRSVLVVDKGPRDWRGLGMVSGGDMIVMQPEFNVKDLLDELVYYYDGLCDQEQLAVILEASYDRFRDLENWGHIFARDENGTLLDCWAQDGRTPKESILRNLSFDLNTANRLGRGYISTPHVESIFELPQQ